MTKSDTPKFNSMRTTCSGSKLGVCLRVLGLDSEQTGFARMGDLGREQMDDIAKKAERTAKGKSFYF